MDRLRWRLVLTVAVVAVVASGCTFVARVSVDTNGVQGNAESNHPALDGDGRYVAFSSVAGDLVAGDSNAREDVFVRDNVTHVVERVSVSTDGTEANGGSSNPAISDDGRYVAFDSACDESRRHRRWSAEQRVRPRPPDRRDDARLTEPAAPGPTSRPRAATSPSSHCRSAKSSHCSIATPRPWRTSGPRAAER